MKISNSILVTVALAAISTVTNAAPVPFDGRFYDVVVASGIGWQDAKTAAEGLSHQNVQGHLATINTKAENDFIKTLYDSNFPGGSRTELWLGGSQKGKGNCPPVPNPEPGCGWEWENGETIPVPNNPSSFGWLLGEPSNGPGGAEDNLTFGRAGSSGWNDENQTNNIWGYVVEYGDKLRPMSARNCALNDATPGCKLAAGTVNGTVITLPLKVEDIPSGTTVTVSTQLITNDAARCAPQPPQTPQTLSLFGGDVIVPKYLCGHPDFLVAKVETSPPGFQINTGVVEILNGNELLTGNLYECQPSGVDPTEADVVGYQSSAGALEKDFVMEIDDIFVGSVGEFTNACGSSRGSGPGRSYYFAGLRIHPGPGNGAVANPDGNRQFRFKLLTYKLDVLAKAVSNACGDKAFSNGVCSSLTSQVKNIRGDLTNGNDGEAKAHVKNLQKTLKGTTFKIIVDENHSGEINSRVSNIAFTLNKFFP